MEKDAIRVVIADDEPISRMDLKELLTEGGYTVVAEVSDGFDAVENCKLYHPDLVLLDIKMPFLDGLAAAKIIYEEELADTIIMLTAYSEREFVEQAKDYGVSGYLVKPIDEKSLIPNIELVVAQSKEMKRLRKDMAKVSERLANRSIIEKAKGQVMQEQNLSEQEAYHYVIIQDVTWRREQEQALILKSVAIKEIHHRVKNNLQTIASLLRLQTRRTDSEETRQVLGESMNRILSIASTHELLAQSGVDEVMLGEVILNIKNNTMRYFSNPKCYVTITMEGGDFQVDSDIATSVAIIINELLQNSLKYAFQDRSSGEIRIVVEQGKLYSSIQVSDNGGGFDVANTEGNRLGLSIVQTLVKDKLRGNLEIESGPEGTCARFDFKNQIIGTADVT